jgi:hypothetical protein
MREQAEDAATKSEKWNVLSEQIQSMSIGHAREKANNLDANRV